MCATADTLQHSANAIQIYLGRRVMADTEPVAHQCYDREQGTVAVVGGALAAQQTMGLLPYPLCKRFQQPRFPHPGLADQQHDVAISPRRALPRVIEKCQFALASDDGTSSRGMCGRKPALGWALTNRLPDRNWLVEALDRMFAEK